MKRFTLLLIYSIALSGVLYSQTKTSLRVDSDYYSLLAPFRNAIWFGTNGDISHSPITNGAGWEWTNGSGKTLCFESGLIIGGLIEGSVRISGSKYRHALQGGKILPNGKPSDPRDTLSRVFHITKHDSLNHPDRIQWTLNDGAPVDDNGQPLMYGDEQMWFVSNDLDENRSRYFYGTPPIGIEVQTIAWADGRQWLEDAIFVQYKIINKGNADLKDAYLGLWADFDIGSANDDLVGVDTSIQLYYAYNALTRDGVYGFPPPAAGIVLLEPPIVPSPNHAIITNGKLKRGFRYSSLSGFIMYLCGDAVYREPVNYLPDVGVEMYNNLKGLLWNGNPMTDPTTNKFTHFCVPGDPVKKQDG